MPEVRLVGGEGEQIGIVATGEALRLAQEADLDLVEVAPDAHPPVCKLMDYGKFRYENAQKAREARRNQVLTVIKEMKLRPKIDSHDNQTKKGHVERFLQGRGQGEGHHHGRGHPVRRLRDAESTGMVGSWELDLDTDTVTWSNGMFELFGIDPERSGDDLGSTTPCRPECRRFCCSWRSGRRTGRTGRRR